MRLLHAETAGACLDKKGKKTGARTKRKHAPATYMHFFTRNYQGSEKGKVHEVYYIFT